MSNLKQILGATAHRPWPLPTNPWVMTQTWQNLLFAHYAMEPDQLAPFIPHGLELELYEGQAWVSVVPFQMGYQLRYSPFDIKFGELNVRTYVRHGEKPGVFFFSLDASDLPVVLSARLLFSLPYYPATIQLAQQSDSITFQSQRWASKTGVNRFKATYGPVSEVTYASRGSLEDWLTERYCLYSVTSSGQLYRGNVHHLPWSLQQAEARISANTLVVGNGLYLPERPDLIQYAEHLDVVIWMPEKIN